MDIIWLLSVLNFIFVSCITPGPNNIMLLSSGARFGYLPSMPHLFGILCGFGSMLFIIGLGLGELFVIFPIIQIILAVFGSLFMVYLAYKIYHVATLDNARSKDRPMRFMEAFLFQPFNPKAWVMATASIATFTQAVDYNIALVVIIVGFSAANVLTGSLWLFFGITIGKIVKTKPQYFSYFNKLMALLLLLSIITIWVI